MDAESRNEQIQDLAEVVQIIKAGGEILDIESQPLEYLRPHRLFGWWGTGGGGLEGSARKNRANSLPYSALHKRQSRQTSISLQLFHTNTTHF